MKRAALMDVVSIAAHHRRAMPSRTLFSMGPEDPLYSRKCSQQQIFERDLELITRHIHIPASADLEYYRNG